MTTINKIENSTLTTRLESVDTNFSQKMENTIALAFYGLVYGDISSITERTNEIIKQLDTTYRKYIPAKFDSKSNKWIFSKPKAIKLRELFDITVDTTNFDEFLASVNKIESDIELKKNNEADSITPEEKLAASKLKVTKYLTKALDGELTIAQIESILATLKAKGAK